jgi:hypothetical protein
VNMSNEEVSLSIEETNKSVWICSPMQQLLPVPSMYHTHACCHDRRLRASLGLKPLAVQAAPAAPARPPPQQVSAPPHQHPLICSCCWAVGVVTDLVRCFVSMQEEPTSNAAALREKLAE